MDQGTLRGIGVFAASVEEDWGPFYMRSVWFGGIYAFLEHGTVPLLRKTVNVSLDYHLTTGKMWRTFRGEVLLCVPEPRIRQVLEEAHDNNRHWGREGTMAKLRGAVYWPGQAADVERYITGCIQCARHRPAQRSEHLDPAIMSAPFELFGMDFIGPLPRTTQGNQYILHVIDYFSRYSFTEASATNTVLDVVARLTRLFQEFTKPLAFYFDSGHHFDNDTLRSFLSKRGIRFKYGPSGSSKSMGLVERGNRILEDVL